MNLLKKYIRFVDSINDKIGVFVSWLTTLMVLTVFYDVVLRYCFNRGNIAIQELEWHLFAIIFLIGAAYALKSDAHVRVDILYTRFNAKTKAWIDFLGTFIFLIPFAIMVIYSTNDFILNSWAVKEVSPDPGGLPARYLLKAMIALGFLLLIFQGLSQAFKNFLIIVGNNKEGDK